jgi:hypothetical protein
MRKKSQLNSEKIWKIQKKSKLLLIKNNIAFWDYFNQFSCLTNSEVGSKKIIVANKEFLLTGTNGTTTDTLEFVYTVKINDNISAENFDKITIGRSSSKIVSGGPAL